MNISFNVDGAKQLSRSIDILVKDLPKLKGFYKEAVSIISKRSDQLFKAKGKNVEKGNKWKGLSSSTLEARSKRHGYYKNAPSNPSVLRWTGALQNNKKETSTDIQGKMEFGSRYAIYHHRGMGSLPSRPIIDLSNKINADIIRAMQKELHKKFKISRIRTK